MVRQRQGQPRAEVSGVSGKRQPEAGPGDVPERRWRGRVADDEFDLRVARWGSSASGFPMAWTRSLSPSVAARRTADVRWSANRAARATSPDSTSAAAVCNPQPPSSPLGCGEGLGCEEQADGDRYRRRPGENHGHVRLLPEAAPQHGNGGPVTVTRNTCCPLRRHSPIFRTMCGTANCDRKISCSQEHVNGTDQFSSDWFAPATTSPDRADSASSSVCPPTRSVPLPCRLDRLPRQGRRCGTALTA